jgi:NAD(P)-dependent dehydrogenase (short-subunit alcohol dehydrogenase family)
VIFQNKNAIIYGAGGSLGGAVAKALADAGARLFLTGRNLSSVQKVADEILSSGGRALQQHPEVLVIHLQVVLHRLAAPLKVSPETWLPSWAFMAYVW